MSTQIASPLRRAVLTCLGYSAPWDVETVRELAGVTQRAARMYLTQLVRRQVIVEDAQVFKGRFSPGPQAEAYKAERPKTKPGGNSRRYKAQRQITDELAARDWAAKRAGLAGLTSEPVQVEHDEVMDATITDDALKITDVAERLSVSRWTVKRWLAKGMLKGYVLPNGQWRVSRVSVEQIFKRRIGDA